MKAEQELLLLHDAGHLHDGDGEAVDGGGEHGRAQRQVLLVQELCGGASSRLSVQGDKRMERACSHSPSSTNCFISIS